MKQALTMPQMAILAREAFVDLCVMESIEDCSEELINKWMEERQNDRYYGYYHDWEMYHFALWDARKKREPKLSELY